MKTVLQLSLSKQIYNFIVRQIDQPFSFLHNIPLSL